MLHTDFDWYGKQVHETHHQKPYYHISIDPPELIGAVMGTAALVFWLVFAGGPLYLTATATYYIMGLHYEWVHYVVHTRWVPDSKWYKAVRRHHMLHHCRNEDYWLSFSIPAVDQLFGTRPSTGSSVPITTMARQTHLHNSIK
eukprot:jgi/Chrzof1/4899/Cz15g03180.t1